MFVSSRPLLQPPCAATAWCLSCVFARATIAAACPDALSSSEDEAEEEQEQEHGKDQEQEHEEQEQKQQEEEENWSTSPGPPTTPMPEVGELSISACSSRAEPCGIRAVSVSASPAHVPAPAPSDWGGPGAETSECEPMCVTAAPQLAQPSSPTRLPHSTVTESAHLTGPGPGELQVSACCERLPEEATRQSGAAAVGPAQQGLGDNGTLDTRTNAVRVQLGTSCCESQRVRASCVMLELVASCKSPLHCACFHPTDSISKLTIYNSQHK